MAHSKAPWHVNQHGANSSGSDRFLWSADETERGCIARLNQMNPNAADNESLILAATDLLEACDLMATQMRHVPASAEKNEALSKGRAAIAAATGTPAGWTHAETHAPDDPTQQEPTIAVPLSTARNVSRALGLAEAFMSGFEGDECQETLEDDLQEVRNAEEHFDALLPSGGLEATEKPAAQQPAGLRFVKSHAGQVHYQLLDARGSLVAMLSVMEAGTAANVATHLNQALAAHQIEPGQDALGCQHFSITTREGRTTCTACGKVFI